MRRFPAIIICLLLFAGFTPAQEVKLPPTIKALPGQWIVVAPESVDGGLPRWRSSEGLSEVDLSALFPTDLLKQARGRVFTATRPGTYIVEAWNAKGDVASAISRCVITVIGTPSDPMPDPKPDDPPKDPPPVTTGPIWLVIVQPDGSISDEVDRASRAVQANFPDAKFLRREVSKCSPDIQADVKEIPLPALLIRQERTVDGKVLTFDLAKPQALPPSSLIAGAIREATKGVVK